MPSVAGPMVRHIVFLSNIYQKGARVEPETLQCLNDSKLIIYTFPNYAAKWHWIKGGIVCVVAAIVCLICFSMVYWKGQNDRSG